jgi:hypothetical protein
VIVMITRARGSGRPSSTAAAATVFLLSGVLAAAAAGAALGGVAALFPTAARVVLALLAIAVIGYRAMWRAAPWQWDRETPASWLDHGDWRTAAYNGATLGAGCLTRIGFWAFYLLPVAVIVHGGAVAGAVVFAAYALTRCAAGLVVAAAGSERIAGGLLRAKAALTVVADVVLFLGIGFLIARSIP